MARNVLIMMLLSACLASCNKDHARQYQGYIEGANLYLASPFSGELQQAFVERGQSVKKNQVLFQLDENPQRLLINQQTALLKQARAILNDLKNPKRPPEIDVIKAQIGQVDAQIRLSQLRVKRNEALVRKRFLDQDSLDASIERLQELQYLRAQYEANLILAKEGSRQDQIKAQEAKMKSLAAKIKEAQWDLAQKTIKAPADGVIFDTYFHTGDWVPAQKPLAALLAPDNVRVEFFVPVQQLPQLHLNQAITLQCDGCTNGEAHISYISPRAEYIPPLVYSRQNNDKLVFRVEGKLVHPEAFKPGQPVIVSVTHHD